MSELPSEDYFRSIDCHAGLGILATDEQFRIRFCNQAAVHLLGRPAAELIGEDIKTIVPPARAALAQRLLDHIVQTGESSDFELEYERPDGRMLHLAVVVSPVRDGERLAGVSVFLRDISRRLHLLRDMAQAQKMAALESMAGALAHHFNNILGGAITTADFALAGDDPDLHRRTLGLTVTALSRANELTRGLLAFAEGEHSDTTTADIRQTLERYLAALDETLKARRIRLEADIQPVSASAPPTAVTVILDRLIANAVEAMPNGGTLRIRLATRTDDQVLLCVGDTGCGIAREILPRMFEPFFTTRQPDRGGTSPHHGLGLAIVHGIVKDLGGTVSVDSAPGSGTTITIHLPGLSRSES
ncbi:MAG: PAS domain-containing protein [Planctomycetes bacterium]|nr:PAS domain-containing protein [Planctomycetota bacterium]